MYHSLLLLHTTVDLTMGSIDLLIYGIDSYLPSTIHRNKDHFVRYSDLSSSKRRVRPKTLSTLDLVIYSRVKTTQLDYRTASDGDRYLRPPFLVEGGFT